MRILNILSLMFVYFVILTSGQVAVYTEATSPKQKRVTIRVVGDSIEGSSLGLLVRYKKATSRTWQELFSKESMADNTIQLTVPEAGRIAIELSTSDPTIISTESTTDFFTLETGKRSIVAHKYAKINQNEFDVEIPIRLQKVSAAKLCIPMGFSSGAVQFTQRVVKPGRALVYSVNSRQMVENRWFAGISPGIWDVIYVDDDDNVLFRTEVLLSKGDAEILECS